MGKKRHFPGAKTDKTVTHKEKHTEQKHDNVKQLKRVMTKIANKGKDEVKKTAVKIQKIKEDVPKKAPKTDVKTNDKPEVANLKPEVTVDEKPVPKDEEDDSEESGEESKADVENDNDDGVDDADDSNSDDDDAQVSDINHAAVHSGQTKFRGEKIRYPF